MNLKEHWGGIWKRGNQETGRGRLVPMKIVGGWASVEQSRRSKKPYLSGQRIDFLGVKAGRQGTKAGLKYKKGYGGSLRNYTPKRKETTNKIEDAGREGLRRKEVEKSTAHAKVYPRQHGEEPPKVKNSRSTKPSDREV